MSSSETRVPLPDGGDVSALIYDAGPRDSSATLVLAHGAGAGQQSAFMVATAEALASRGISVATFNFPYTEQGRRLPDRRPVLEGCYRAVIAHVQRERQVPSERLFIGGKSMGGRIATHVVSMDGTTAAAGVVLLGYPLHPPGKPLDRRDAHFPSIRCPMLFVQGSRDAFGTPDELGTAVGQLSGRYDLHVVEGGDHSFKIGRAGISAQQATLAAIYDRVAGWIGDISAAGWPGTPPPRH